MSYRIIGMFNKALKGNNINYLDIVRASAAAGYIIHPDCATTEVMKFLKEQKANLNSTFYKTWTDVTSKSREDIFADQLKHYATTYGSLTPNNIDKSTVYTQNKDPIIIDYNSYKVIMPATVDEIFDDCMKLLQSGIALKPDTINIIEKFISKNNLIDKINIDSIKNKEAKCILAYRLDKVPTDEFDIFRTIIYNYTSSSMIIKDISHINALRYKTSWNKEYDFSKLTEDNLKSLSKIFYRFKPLFLALKKNRPHNKYYINKIRRYAKKYHKPFTKGFWEDCLALRGRNASDLLETAKRKVCDITNFKKIQLMQAIKARLIDDSNSHIYIIRNGKQFLKQDYKANVDKDYLTSLYEILKSSVVESLKEKATTYSIADNLHIVAPTSEKNFVGNYPIGTHIDFTNLDNIVGIYWRNEWGAHDFDIHCASATNERIGWNSAYYSGNKKSVIYSGDMTNADPEAAELLYFSDIEKDYTIKVNKFNGSNNAKFKLFVATEDITDKLRTINLSKRYDLKDHYDKIMVDPNNIRFEAIVELNDASEMNIGYIHNKKLYLMSLITGNSRCSRLYDDTNKAMQKANAIRAESYIDIEELLLEAGFKKTAVAELDFSNLSKDKIIGLFS